MDSGHYEVVCKSNYYCYNAVPNMETIAIEKKDMASIVGEQKHLL